MTSNTRYNNGKIYKIINNFNDMVYIGSTCLPLRKRIFNHKKEERTGRSPNRHLFQLVREAPNGWDDFQIVLIENYSCNNKDELLRHEEQHRAQFVAVTSDSTKSALGSLSVIVNSSACAAEINVCIGSVLCQPDWRLRISATEMERTAGAASTLTTEHVLPLATFAVPALFVNTPPPTDTLIVDPV